MVAGSAQRKGHCPWQQGQGVATAAPVEAPCVTARACHSWQRCRSSRLLRPERIRAPLPRGAPHAGARRHRARTAAAVRDAMPAQCGSAVPRLEVAAIACACPGACTAVPACMRMDSAGKAGTAPWPLAGGGCPRARAPAVPVAQGSERRGKPPPAGAAPAVMAGFGVSWAACGRWRARTVRRGGEAPKAPSTAGRVAARTRAGDLRIVLLYPLHANSAREPPATLLPRPLARVRPQRRVDLHAAGHSSKSKGQFSSARPTRAPPHEHLPARWQEAGTPSSRTPKPRSHHSQHPTTSMYVQREHSFPAA